MVLQAISAAGRNGTYNPGGRNRTSDFPDISRVHSPLYYARRKHSGWNSNPQRLLRRQAIYPVNRPEYEQGLPGSNRRRRFWRPLCFRLHQAPLNIPDRTRTCTAGTGIRYGRPFHHGDKALPKRFELLYDSLEGCCSYPLSYGNIKKNRLPH